jgi:hypothetical protein
MWNVVESVKSYLKARSVTPEERELMDENVARLRQRARRVPMPVTTAKTTMSGASYPVKKVSLFDSVKHIQPSERHAVGHWCEASAAAAREEHTARVEHSYEADFASATNFEDSNLYPFLAKSAQNKALHGFIMNADLSRPDTSAQFDSRYEAPMPSVIEMKSLTEMEELLLRFAQDESDEFSRTSVAGNEKAPAAAMWLLAADKSNNVKLALVENPRVPLAVLEVLGKDFDAKVARRAQSKIKQIASNETGIAFGNLSRDPDFAKELEEVAPLDIRRAV